MARFPHRPTVDASRRVAAVGDEINVAELRGGKIHERGSRLHLKDHAALSALTSRVLLTRK